MKSKNACAAAHCSLAHFPTIEDMSSLISHQWCSRSLCPAPQEDFENNLAITLGMLRRPLKTLRRATGPIVSCMGAAKAPKGTKKPALTPGIMRNHVQSAPGA